MSKLTASELTLVAELEDCALLALEEAWAKFPMKQKPALVSRSYRVTAGMAYFHSWEIGISFRVLKTAEDVRETVLHEYAHLLAVDRHGRKGAGHGVYWQQAMSDLGLVPKVRHNLPVDRNQSRQMVIYQCRRCGALIERKRLLPKRRRYLHRSCGGFIRFVETVVVTKESS